MQGLQGLQGLQATRTRAFTSKWGKQANHNGWNPLMWPLREHNCAVSLQYFTKSSDTVLACSSWLLMGHIKLCFKTSLRSFWQSSFMKFPKEIALGPLLRCCGENAVATRGCSFLLLMALNCDFFQRAVSSPSICSLLAKKLTIWF